MERVIALREAGRYREAIAILKGDAAADPALLALLLSLDGQDEEAWTVLRAAQRATPDSPHVRRTHARLLQKSGQHPAALVEAEVAHRADPNDPETILMLASALANNGKPEADALVERALGLRPDYAEALALRGMLRNNPRDLEAALDLKPHLAGLWAPLATLHHRAGNRERAKVAYLNALCAQPRADLHTNLGAILIEDANRTEALEHFDRAIALDPGLAAAHSNRSKPLKDMGRLEEAEAACRRAIALNPGYADAHHNLANVLSYLDDEEGAKDAYLTTARLAPAGLGLIALVELACSAFIEGDLDRSRQLVEAASAVADRKESLYRPALAYWNFLDRLLEQPRTSAAGDILHVVGDSHALSYVGVALEIDGRTFRGAPTLIKGCKQWHLANDAPNPFKVQFGKVMGRLEGPILLTVGEIDCRPTEGIFAHWRKNPDRNLDEMIDQTTSRFLDRAGRRPIIIAGIPAPTGGEPAFRDCVRRFNDTLKKHTLARGLRFLDVYTMTDHGDGMSNDRWHIDGTHLRPEAMREAFARHLLKGVS